MSLSRSAQTNRSSGVKPSRKISFPLILGIALFIFGALGFFLIEWGQVNLVFHELFIWLGRGLLGISLLGSILLMIIFIRDSDKKGNLREMLDFGNVLAEKEIPALTAALTSLTQGDFTRRLSIKTTPLESNQYKIQYLPQIMNNMLANVQECARSFNWITDEPCNRLFYVGTDSFQEGQIAGGVMGKLSGGKGKVILVGAFNQDNLVLRKNGFQAQILEKYAGLSVLSVLDTATLSEEELISSFIALVEQNSDIVGCYAAEIESLRVLAGIVVEKHWAGKFKLLSHDLTSTIADYLDKGILSASVTQNPFIQGFDPVIHLYNRVVAGWHPSAERLLIEPEVVTKENLYNYWRIDKGAVQSQAMLDARPKAEIGHPHKPLNIAMISLGFEFFDQVKIGVSAASKRLRDENVNVDWLIPEEAVRNGQISVSAEIYGPYLESISRKYDAIGICIADSAMVPYINRIVEKGIPVATFNAEPGSLRGLMHLMVNRAAQLLVASQELTDISEASHNNVILTAETIQQIAKAVNEEAVMMNQANQRVEDIVNSIQNISTGAKEQV